MRPGTSEEYAYLALFVVPTIITYDQIRRTEMTQVVLDIHVDLELNIFLAIKKVYHPRNDKE